MSSDGATSKIRVGRKITLSPPTSVNVDSSSTAEGMRHVGDVDEVSCNNPILSGTKALIYYIQIPELQIDEPGLLRSFPRLPQSVFSDPSFFRQCRISERLVHLFARIGPSRNRRAACTGKKARIWHPSRALGLNLILNLDLSTGQLGDAAYPR